MDDDNNSNNSDANTDPWPALNDPLYVRAQAFVDHLDDFVAGVQQLDPITADEYLNLHRRTALLSIEGLTQFLLWLDGRTQ